MKHAVYIEKLVDCELTIEGKVKSIFVNKCQNLKLSMYSVLTNMEIMDCSKVTLNVLQSCPTLVVSNSKTVSVFLHQKGNCDLITGMSNEVNITFKKEDETFEVEILLILERNSCPNPNNYQIR